MEIIRNGCCSIKSFVSSVIEWRSAATAPYFMFINSIFWWSVFYLDTGAQLRLLVSFAAGIFSWDILLSSTYDRSILFYILTWPMRSVLRTSGVAMALCSAQFLYRTEFEKACWTAYSAVALLMINPVWVYHQVPQKINECLYTACITTKYVAQITIISPLYSFYRIVEYIVKLRWLTAILEKVKKELLRIKAAARNTYVAAVDKLCAGKNAILSVTNSILFSIGNFMSCTIYGFKIAIRNGVMYAVTTTRNGIVCAITSTKNGIISIIMFLKNGILFGSLTLKNGLIGGILQLKNCLIMCLNKSRNAFYHAVTITKNYIRYTLVTIKNSILNFFSAAVKWMKTEIVEPVRNAFHAVVQFLRYWLCAHWWPNLKSWFVLHIVSRLQLLFNYFCFGIVYVFFGYWMNPFITFLSRHFRRFCAYFQQYVLNPFEIWIGHQIDKALLYIKRMLHSLAMRACAHLYRILLQPIIDILYKKYKICEDYLLIYCLGPICQIFVNHIPDRSPFCDDTDTELADLLPPGFSNEESDIEQASDKPSLPSRPLSPLTEDERDFVRGLKFPNLDSSDSSEAEFALRPKSKLLRKKPKVHPKDPAPSACSDGLISKAYEVKNKHKRSSSTSSHSESAISSSAQNASDDADPQNLDVFDFESESRPRAEFLGNTVEIQKLGDYRDGRSKGKKQNTNQKEVEEIEVCGTEQLSVSPATFTGSLDDSFEMLDK
ncbi:unnamed protein product [Cercopithifilaria johnstoni]|uniref:Uncharacterized protein n=1 Tax=Cercopithifilaria johnstoni TaxID=2874296 RepID=A0A8J2M0S9_9BILA|nr:unnamed protein product [Cercopithifilaria johnstoni]